MIIHDIVKTELVSQGYLPDHPYHLISDEEMFNAFLDRETVRIARVYSIHYKLSKIANMEVTAEKPTEDYMEKVYGRFEYDYNSAIRLVWTAIEGATYKVYVEDEETTVTAPDNYPFEDHSVAEGMISILGTHVVTVRAKVEGKEVGIGSIVIVNELEEREDCYFTVNYPCLSDDLVVEYSDLLTAIRYHIDSYLSSTHSDTLIIPPDWVYSYIVGSVISNNSRQQDRHDMLVMLNLDNIEDEITPKVQHACLLVSNSWLNKLTPDKKDHRPPTMFGEPHVIKSLRVFQADMR